MFGLGPMELVLIFLVILLVFGAKRIPEIAHGIGKGITEFKKAARDVTDEFDTNSKTANNPPVRNELRGQRISDKPQQTPPQQTVSQQAAPQQTNEQVKSPEKKEG
jgi:sec-independent protein translocase protein TatA